MKATKKTLTFAFALAALLCLLVLSAGAYNGTEYGNTGIYYSISNGDAVITDARSDIETADIPESIGKYTVTGIEGFAFKECTALTSVTIPKSVTRIGSSAFISCTSLSSITIPENVTSIGDYAFRDCSALNKINWNAESVRDFSQYNVVFSNAGTSGDGIDVVFGDNVRCIPAYLFYGAGSPPYKSPKIKTITLGNNVTSIGISAFRNCNAFSNITIPNSVTRIGSSAFKGCSSLSSIAIPSSVKSIGWTVFDISSLDLYISDLASWCSIEFKSSISTGKYKLYLNGNRITDLIIPDGVTGVNDYAFDNCDGLTSVTIPNSVINIGKSAFSGCSFTEIKIGNGLKSVGENAFNGIKVIPDLYYAGSEEEWSKTSLDSTNEFIQRANMHYNADTGHKHNYTEIITQNATCTTDGTKILTCSCGNSCTEVIPATGHTEVIDKAAVAATCTEKGKTEDKHCSVCGAVIKAQKTVPALGHKYKTTTKKATTSKDGKAVTACTVCKKISKTTVIYKASSIKLSKTSYTYNGKAQKPKVAVKNSKGKALTEGKDYTVKYQSGRKNPGCYTVTVTFKGNYSGKKTLTFTIAPKAPTLKVKAGTKKATLSWNKQTGATGYNVYMATSKNGKYKKIATVKVGSKTSYTAAKLTKGKTVYFKVVSYTASGKTTVRSAYSKAVGAKIK